MKTRAFLCFLACGSAGAFFLVSACSPKAHIGREQAVAIAKREAGRRGWSELEVEYVLYKSNIWFVRLWRIPKTPGGFTTVEISGNGDSIRYIPGH